ncbi:hypothetical protein [Bacillus thuringiensis]|nr:hypothetical protein [Bacillus thuringiensis]
MIISGIIGVVGIKDVKRMIYGGKVLVEKGIGFVFYVLGGDREEGE